jgi:hypothetical protein
VVDLTGIVGYFSLISMVLNGAYTPQEPNDEVKWLPAFPL